MTKHNHTPGPWTWQLQPYSEPNDDDPCAEVSVVNSVGVCRVADARLIAAAPDLLAACEKAIADDELDVDTSDMLEAAIKKARGES